MRKLFTSRDGLCGFGLYPNYISLSKIFLKRVDMKVIELLKEADGGAFTDKKKNKNWPSCKKLNKNKSRK